jgi:hypothetical protein
MKTDAEIAEQAAKDQRMRDKVNEILGYLNPVGAPISKDLTIMTADGPKAYNLMELAYAIYAQCVGAMKHHTSLPDETDIDYVLFPGVVFSRTGEKLVKKHYHVDAPNKSARLVVTYAMPREDGTTTGQPRYEVTYLSGENCDIVDNFAWRLVVNGIIRRFKDVGYIYLFNHSFEFIQDIEAATIAVIPAKTQEDPTPLSTVVVE